MPRSRSQIQKTVLKHLRRASGSSTVSAVDFTSAGTWSFGGEGGLVAGQLLLDLRVVPDAIADLAEVSWDGLDLTVSWTDPWNGGATIDYVGVWVSTTSPPVVGDEDQQIALGAQTATVTFTAGQTLNIAVVAHNAKGYAEISNIITVTAPLYVEDFTIIEASWGTVLYEEDF